MINGVLTSGLNLASLSFYGGGVGEVLAQWEQAGVFTYVLPFILIFSIVHVILSSLKIFGSANKGFSGLIAIAVALMALQFEMVPLFFSTIFPRMGIALAIILAIFIVFGLFSPDKKWMSYVYLGIGAVILIVLLISTGTAFGNDVSFWLQENWETFLWAVVIIVIGALIAGMGKENTEDPGKSPIERMFGAIGK